MPRLLPALLLWMVSSTVGCRGCDDPTTEPPTGESSGAATETPPPSDESPEGSAAEEPTSDGSAAAAPGEYPLREAIMEARQAQDAGTATGSHFNPRQRLQPAQSSAVRQLNPETRQRLLERRLRNQNQNMSLNPGGGAGPVQLRMRNPPGAGSGEGAPGPYNMRIRQAREL